MFITHLYTYPLTSTLITRISNFPLFIIYVRIEVNILLTNAKVNLKFGFIRKIKSF